jgi:outer membrane protein assembly factor BamB
MRKFAVLLTALFSATFFALQADAAEISPKFSSQLTSGAIAVVYMDSSAFILQEDGTLTAVGIKSGNKLWTSKVADAKALCAGKDIVIAVSGKSVEMLSSITGKSLGKIPAVLEGAGLLAAPEIVSDTLLVQSGDESTLVSIKNKKVLAKVKSRLLCNHPDGIVADRFWKNAFDEADKTVAVSDAATGEVRLLDTETGKTLWTAKSPGVQSFPTIFDEWVMVQAPGVLLTFDKKTGKPVGNSRIETRSPVFPAIHFMAESKHAVFSGSDRLINLDPLAEKPGMDLIVPGRLDIVAGDGKWVYFLYRYKRQSDGKDMSVLMGHNIKNAQLYGREPVEGNATGRFLQVGSLFAAELAPGTLRFVRKSDMKDIASASVGNPLAGMAVDGEALLLVGTDGKLNGFDLSSLK